METVRMYQFIISFWKLLKNYNDNPPKKDSEWDVCIGQFKGLTNQFGTDDVEKKFIRRLVMAAIDYFGAKEGRGK